MADIQTNLQKWAVQPTSDSGYQIPFQFGFEVLTTLYPEVVIGAEGTWQVMDVNTNVFNFPRAQRNDRSTIKRNVKLGTEMSFDYTSGEYDNVKLDNQLAIAQVFQNFEIADTNSDIIGFRVQEAVRQVAREYEDIAIKDLIDKGTQGTVKYDADNKADVYATILEIKTQMELNGSDASNLVIYITPELFQKLYTKGIIVAGGIGNVPAMELRNGMTHSILGIPVLSAPRLSTRWHTFETGKVANMLVVDRTQVILLRRMVQPVVMERAPATYPAECSLLKCLEYIKHYVVNANGVYYVNVVDPTNK